MVSPLAKQTLATDIKHISIYWYTSVGKLPQTPDVKALLYCDTQRDLSSGEMLNLAFCELIW